MRSLIRTTSALLALLVSASGLVSAQVSITSSDVLGLVGTSQRLVSDTTFDVTVNVGLSGANRTWDLSTINVSGVAIDQSFLTPNQTPFAAEFPSANFVFQISGPEFEGLSFFQFLLVNSSGITELGDAIDYGDSTHVSVESSPQTIVLPLEYNDSWIDSESDTLGTLSSFGTVTRYTTTNLVDGWGTVTVPFGSFDALRIREDDVEITDTYISGSVVFSDTSRHIGYQWISPTGFLVAFIGSHDGETNPNFTNAEQVEMLAAVTTAVDPREQPDAVLLAAYPNPFTDHVDITYNSPARTVELAVFDILGRRVRTLIQQSPQVQERNVVVWDGTSDAGAPLASGIYLVRLATSESTTTKQIVLLR